MEEDEDRDLLSSLDIERNVLSEARNHAGNGGKVGGDIGEEPFQRSGSTDPSSVSRAKLCNKFRAIEYEITDDASTVEQARNITSNDDHAYDGDDNLEQADGVDGSQAYGLYLQHAFVADRLRSLKKRKAQMENELSDFCRKVSFN